MTEITFDGYYRDPADLPEESGIYVVHACVWNPAKNVIAAGRIIYIGKADNLRERHFKGNTYCHERKTDFQNECKDGETVFYSFARVEARSLDKVENALIAMQQPPLNGELKYAYNHEKDTFRLYGTVSDSDAVEFGFSDDKDITSMFTVDEADTF